MKELELWGGPECTLNRVENSYRDQLVRSGHYDRDGDLDLFADLGISAIRYPVLWERVAPTDDEPCDWNWPDRQLPRLRALDIRVIAGLCHHGSGPRHTDLLDPGFATGLAAFAAKVAERYDWITDWTPVNEPLTTARFAALYGHWYPHRRSEAAFWHALVNQIDGVRLSMQAVRRINPRARLIQTDDLGRTYATVAMRDQAAFDNVRRWASWDMLCGRVTREHPFWTRLCGFGLESRLRAIADDPCLPDVIGVNHYLTSDRFLDHRLRRYPAATHGGNRRARFADVEAVRVLDPAPPGLAGTLREAWERYGIPLAITEVHNGCTRDEQMRWIADAWDTAAVLRAEGVAIEAVTAWALLGSFDWNTLVRQPGAYEVGAFDVSGGAPRPTAVAPLLTGLTRGADRHPVTRGTGWWQRPVRIVHPPVSRPASLREHDRVAAGRGTSQPLMICGATGMLGQALARACAHRDIHHVVTSRYDLDICEETTIAATLDRHAPWAVIDATGWVRVDEAEANADACKAVNVDGAVALARACDARGIPSVHFSSDLVFDGTAGRAYTEDDVPAPLSAYGRSKVAMEEGVGALPGAHMVIRTASIFSPEDPRNFAMAVTRALRRGRALFAAQDQIISPTYVLDLVDRVLDLTIDGASGIWHVTNDDGVSWADFARRIARAAGLDDHLIRGIPGAEIGMEAPLPACVVLRSNRGQGLGSLDGAIADFVRRLPAQPAAPVHDSPVPWMLGAAPPTPLVV
ncbi:sugar nucleotide-binding protein [Sphingomonas sp.]|uniref:sugar nucleotide-binding protein n=1 Tax=Sphingomonas sp. TaxID=28214 RepID=UPI002EDB72CA